MCAQGNTVSIFAPGQHVIQPGGNSLDVSGEFSSFPGLGIQVNNWYWTEISLPVQRGDPQNPDNSGAQFAISDQCVLACQPAVWQPHRSRLKGVGFRLWGRLLVNGASSRACYLRTGRARVR